jgi:branched-chain amino acid transport system substrate-binding protein
MQRKSLNYLIILAMVLMFIASSTMNTAQAKKAAEIRIGFYGPITGPSALLGGAQRNGALVAVNEINKAGGVNGMKVKFIEYDDKSSPEQAVKAVTRMINVDKVHVILGSLHSGNILASAPVVEENKIPEIGTGTSPAWLQKGYKFLFRGSVSTAFGNVGLVKGIRQLGLKKIGILTRQDEYGKTGTEDTILKITEAGGMKIVAKETFQPGDTDFTGQLTKLIRSGADALIVYGITEDQALQMKQIRQLGYKGYVFGPEGFTAPSIRQIAGDAANGAVFSAAYVIPDKIADAVNKQEKHFLKLYVKKFKEMPKSDNAYRSYDALKIFFRAIKDANSLDGQKIRDAIENITDFQGIAGTFNFKGNHGEGIKETRAFIIYKGKNILLDKYLKIMKAKK